MISSTAGPVDPTATTASLVARHRGAEIAHVRTMLGAGSTGDGMRLMRIDAPAGAGASSLLDVLAETWSDGPVVRLDARRGDGFADRPDEQLALELRGRSAAARVEAHAQRGRVLLVIDHGWEDDFGAALYGALVDALDEDRDVSVLVVRRVDRGDHSCGTWGEVLTEIAQRRPMPALGLDPLGTTAVRELVELRAPRRTAAERERIVQLAGGLPAIATLLAEAGAGIPDTLAAWVDARLVGLDEDERDALLTLALVDEGLHEAAIDMHPARLPFTSRCVAGAWVVEPPAIRAAIRDAASMAHRRAVAAEADERLAGSSAIDALADRARLHALRGDRPGSRRRWTQIADRLEREGDVEHAVAARRYATAMSDTTEDRLEAVAAAVRTVREQGLRSPAEDLLLQLHRLATAAGDEELIALSIRELAYTRRELALLDHPAILASEAGWAVEARANAAHVVGDYERMAALAERAIARARELGDERLELAARHRLLGASVVVDPGSRFALPAAEAARQLGEVVERAWAIGARHRALLAAEHEGFVLRFTGRFDLLVDRMRERAALAREAGRPNHAAKLEAYEVEGLTELGRLDEAAELLARLEAGTDPAYDDGYGAAFVALGSLLLAVEVGSEAGIRERHRDLVASGNLALQAGLGGVYEMVCVREALELRELDRAAALAASFDSADVDDVAATLSDVARWAAESGHAGLRMAAGKLRERLVATPQDPLVSLAIAEADACLSANPLVELAAVADAWRALGCELRALRLDVVRLQLDQFATEADLRELKALLRRAGMRGAEDRINARIRDLGGRAVARARPRGDAPLSERERQVVELAVEGLTNAEVAERLGIRPATVARILANVYKRHDLRGRAALVGFLDAIDGRVAVA